MDFLSDEQMRAARHGIGPKPSFEWVDLPAGPQALPAWARGLHVDFMIGWGNSPHYLLKALGNLRKWPDKVFHNDGGRYMAVTGDGRAEIYYHRGALSMQPVHRFRAVDGTLRQYRKQPGSWDDPDHGYEPGEWVDVQKMCTTQQQGFGGSHVELQMDDGTEVVLRGPWHGGAPAGWMDIAYVDMTEYGQRYETGRRSRPWHNRTGGSGGLYITEDLFMRLLARFAPHCRCARITDNCGVHLEAVDGSWDVPKAWLPREVRYPEIAGES